MADAKQDAKSGGAPLVPLVLAMVVTVAGAVGGAMFWLTRSGRLPVQAAVAGAPVAAKAEAVKTRLIELPPILANLADPGGGGYLRVVMVVRADDPPPPKDAKPKEEKPPEKGKVVVDEEESLMRDAALSVLGRETSERLLAAEGKEQVKQELREAFAKQVPTVKVDDVLFTEFLVQR